MSKIRNKAELVRRSRGHARLDHVKQGTYGLITANGQADFQGCAIGCLATPHTQRGIRGMLAKLGWSAIHHAKDGGFYEGSEDQLDRLLSEFGIEPELARCAEAIFESLPYHGGAISFIPAFAEALPEGYNLTPKRIKKLWDRATKNGAGDECYMSVDETEADLGYDNVPAVRDRFLDLLRALA